MTSYNAQAAYPHPTMHQPFYGVGAPQVTQTHQAYAAPGYNAEHSYGSVGMGAAYGPSYGAYAPAAPRPLAPQYSPVADSGPAGHYAPTASSSSMLGVTCGDYHNLIHNAATKTVGDLRRSGKITGRVFAVLGGLGAGAGTGVTLAAALGVGSLAAASSTLLFPPVIVAIIGVPLIGGIIAGTMIRAEARRRCRKNPQLQAHLDTLRRIQQTFQRRQDACVKQGTSLPPADLEVLRHVNGEMKKLRTWGAVGRDAGRLTFLGVSVGIFAAAIAAVTVLILAGSAEGGGGGGGCGGGASAAGMPNTCASNTFIFWHTPGPNTGGSMWGGKRRQAAAAAQHALAQQPSVVSAAEAGVQAQLQSIPSRPSR